MNKGLWQYIYDDSIRPLGIPKTTQLIQNQGSPSEIPTWHHDKSSDMEAP